MKTNSFGKKFHAANERKAQHGLMKGPVFLFGGRRGEGSFAFPPCSHHVPYVFP
jgi:hypothetical protein